MRLKNTSILSTKKIMDILKKYEKYFTVEIDPCMEEVVNEQKYPFVNASDGILVCDPQDTGIVGGYGGLTYIYGAVSVYTYQLERIKWDGKLWYLMENRLIHEILHHFNKDSHGLDDWLKKNDMVMYILYHITGCNGENYIGSRCERMYYETLISDIDEVSFNQENHIAERDFRGILNE